MCQVDKSDQILEIKISPPKALFIKGEEFCINCKGSEVFWMGPHLFCKECGSWISFSLVRS